MVSDYRVYPRGERPVRAPGIEFVAEVPEHGKIVSMLVHHDRIYVATERGLYELNQGKLYPIRFASSDASGL